MKFRNPWIDPRILQVRPDAVKAYLLSHGWLYLGPALAPDMLMFDTPQPRDDKPNVILPLKLEHGSQVQRLIELIADVALYEDRYAGDVLTDILRQPPASVPADGSGVPLPTEPTPQ